MRLRPHFARRSARVVQAFRDCGGARVRLLLFSAAGVLAVSGGGVYAQAEGSDFYRLGMTLRADALRRIDPEVIMRPAVAGAPATQRFNGPSPFGRYPWKYNIATTVFWVGEKATIQNAVSNERSAWDPDWVSNYGGVDSPDAGNRKNFMPATFVPGANPFYVALPYNDVDGGHTRPEAARVIPWFQRSFVRDGQSVCKGAWVAVRRGDRVCYAQWEDVGPFATDHWQYVFGNERPRPNPNQNAGLDVSPAVSEYLGLEGIDHCDWKFVDFRSVPFGPWALYGEDNPFVLARRQKFNRVQTGAEPLVLPPGRG